MSKTRKLLNLPPNDQKASGADAPVTVERIKLWIAILSLVAAISVGLFSVYQSNLQSQRLRTVTVAIRDTEDIRIALQKPLEGVWQYRLVFSQYFGEKSAYISTGTAIFLWEPSRQQYQIFIGYSISKEWEKEKLVTGFVNGTLQADELGWPQQGFQMPMKYLERTGVGEFASPLSISFTLTNGRYEKSSEGKVLQILAHYQNPRSLGEMTMSR